MFKRRFTLKKRADFLKIRNSGLAVKKKNVVIQAAIRDSDTRFSHARFGYTATKRIGNSVIRNKCRRRIKHASFAILSDKLESIKNVDFVFIAKKECDRCKFSDLYEQIKNGTTELLKKIAQKSN